MLLSESELHLDAYGPKHLADVELSKQMMEELAKLYPGHNWYVTCSGEKAGTLSIQLLYQDKAGVFRKWAWGMLIHIKNLYSPSAITKYAMKFGGELLERYSLARRSADEYTMLDARSRHIFVDGAV
jgi:hypothetical protein